MKIEICPGPQALCTVLVNTPHTLQQCHTYSVQNATPTETPTQVHHGNVAFAMFTS